jgi:hypothetical protein
LLRTIDTSSFTEPTVKAVAVGVRTDGGAGELASAGNLEQSAIAVRQAAVVALGPEARGVGESKPPSVSGTYARPRPSAPPPATAPTTAASPSPAEAPSPPPPAPAQSVNTAVLTSGPVQDPVTLAKIEQMRNQALTPPVSAANVRLFERASLAIELAQLQLAHRQSAEDTAQSAATDQAASQAAEQNAAPATNAGSPSPSVPAPS